MFLLAALACTASADSAAPEVVPPPTLVINEFLASNDTVLADEFGQYDDWVELHNPGSSPVSFEGLYLTDDREGQPTRWALPADEGLEPGAYVLFWADDDEGQGTHHMSFKLNKSGDELNIYQVVDGRDPVQVDAITYEEQTTDLSYARVPDAGVVWLQGTPTPAATNGTAR